MNAERNMPEIFDRALELALEKKDPKKKLKRRRKREAAARRVTDRGRDDRLPGRPSLRTVRAVLPHTALRSAVLPPRGLTHGVSVGCD